MLTIKTDDLRINVVAIKGEDSTSSYAHIAIFYTDFDKCLADDELISIRGSKNYRVYKKFFETKNLIMLDNTLENILSPTYYEDRFIEESERYNTSSSITEVIRDALDYIREAFTFENEFWLKASARNEDLINFPRD